MEEALFDAGGSGFGLDQPILGCRVAKHPYAVGRDLRIARVAGGRDLEAEPVRIEKERRVVVVAVLREDPRGVQDLGARVHRGRMGGVDVVPRLDRERQVVEPRRVELERLLVERLPQPERAGAPAGKRR